MPKLMAAVASMFLAYVPHWIFGDAMGPMTDFVVCTIFGSVVYAGMLWGLARLRGEY